NVFLIPEAVDQHHWNFQRLCCKYFVDGLIMPKGVIAGVFEDLSPETYLFESSTAAKLAGRSCLHKHIVVIKVTSPPFDFIRASRLLIVNVRHTLLAKCTVVKPVVTHPAVDHRVHRDGYLQRRMRIYQRHQGEETVVGNSQYANLPIAFRNVF